MNYIPIYKTNFGAQQDWRRQKRSYLIRRMKGLETITWEKLVEKYREKRKSLKELMEPRQG